jgi:hypothetical protein
MKGTPKIDSFKKIKRYAKDNGLKFLSDIYFNDSPSLLFRYTSLAGGLLGISFQIFAGDPDIVTIFYRIPNEVSSRYLARLELHLSPFSILSSEKYGSTV